MKKFLFTAALLTVATVHARNFRITGFPDGWQGGMTGVQCVEESCQDGSLTVSKGRFRQTLSLQGMMAFGKPKHSTIDSRAADAPIKMEDFNFDGKPDLVLPSSEGGGPYGSTAHDIYVQTRSGRFVRSGELSDLFINYMIVEADQKHKLIKTFNKSGAAYHMAEYFRVVPGKGLQSVYQCESEAGYGDSGKIRITEKRLTNGKWRTGRKTVTEKQWAKQNC